MRSLSGQGFFDCLDEPRIMLPAKNRPGIDRQLPGDRTGRATGDEHLHRCSLTRRQTALVCNLVRWVRLVFLLIRV